MRAEKFVVVVVVVGMFVVFRIHCRPAVSISVKGLLRNSIKLSCSFAINSGKRQVIAPKVMALPVSITACGLVWPNLVSREKQTFLVLDCRASLFVL